MKQKRVSSVIKCSDLQGFGQGHCEFLFNMVGIYDEMGMLILQVKEDLCLLYTSDAADE